MVLHGVDSAFEIGGEVGFAGVVTADHVDQMVVHDAAVKADFVERPENVDEVIISGIREGLVEATLGIERSGDVADMELEKLVSLG